MAINPRQPLWQPRAYQQEFLEAMRDKRRAILVWARRMGKDYTCLQYMFEQALALTGQYYYVFPFLNQARKAMWDMRDNEGKGLQDLLPKWGIRSFNNGDMKIVTTSGSIIQLMGANNPDSLRGPNTRGFVLTECQDMDPSVDEIIRPILANNQGWLVKVGTPRGKNHFYDTWNMAQGNPEWFSSMKKAKDNPQFDLSEIQRARDEGMSEDMIEQEFNCSFLAGQDAYVYSAQLNQMYNDGRIGHVLVDRSLPVHTAWDLGVSDACCICFFQLVRGGEIHIIDYEESEGLGIEAYARKLQQRDFTYGTHFAPHDVEARSLATGVTLKAQAAKFGINFRTIPRSGLLDGINMTRGTLSRIWIDKAKCRRLIDCIQNYRKAWSPSLKRYFDEPLHDGYSHGADSLRYLALAASMLGSAQSSAQRSGSDLRKEWLSQSQAERVGR